MKNIYYLFLLITPIFAACTGKASEENTNPKAIGNIVPVIPETLSKGLIAHGSLDRWRSFHTLSFELVTPTNTQLQLIDLDSRKLLITDSLYTLGYNGDQVWVSPDLEAFGESSARFYHNLYFYFFSIPYVLADPGIVYDDLGTQTIGDKEYNAIKISYSENIGDSPEDFYVAHFNLETGLMEVLLYTVTYYSKESHEKYNALVYDWQEVNGLQVTKSIKGYKYDSGKLGDLRYEAVFDQVMLSKDMQPDSLFSIPNNFEIDSLTTN
jgi:hypothetical protein